MIKPWARRKRSSSINWKHEKNSKMKARHLTSPRIRSVLIEKKKREKWRTTASLTKHWNTATISDKTRTAKATATLQATCPQHSDFEILTETLTSNWFQSRTKTKGITKTIWTILMSTDSSKKTKMKWRISKMTKTETSKEIQMMLCSKTIGGISQHWVDHQMHNRMMFKSRWVSRQPRGLLNQTIRMRNKSTSTDPPETNFKDSKDKQSRDTILLIKDKHWCWTTRWVMEDKGSREEDRGSKISTSWHLKAKT